MIFASDLDGTLTNQNIGDYMKTNPVRDKERIKKIALGFTPKKGIDILSKMKLSPVIITGRAEFMRGVTEQWLRMYNIPFRELVMMPDGVFDWNKYINYKIIEHKKRPVKFALEDKQSVATILKGVGIPTFLVTDDFEKTLLKAIEET